MSKLTASIAQVVIRLKMSLGIPNSEHSNEPESETSKIWSDLTMAQAERLNFKPTIFNRENKKKVEEKLTELSSQSTENQIKFAIIVNSDGGRLCDEAKAMPDTDFPATRFITEMSGNTIIEFLNNLHGTRNRVKSLKVGERAGDLDFAIMAFEDWIFAFRFSHKRAQEGWDCCLITLSYGNGFRYSQLIDDVKAIINGLNDIV
jgi:hypothetical protein